MKKGSNIKYQAAACISRGNVRENNEDNFYLGGRYLSLEEYDIITREIKSFALPKECGKLLLGVCDGMGGEEYGEVASYVAADSLSKLESGIGSIFCFDAKSKIIKHFGEMNKRVYQKRCELKANVIGTTCALLYLDKDGIVASSVGDSRIYQIRGSRIRQLTVDHTELQMYIDAGVISKENSRNHPAGNRLTQYLGAPSDRVELSPCYAEVGAPTAGDVFILCSDGLTDMVADADILKLCNGKDSPEEIAKALVNGALEGGGWDNITVVAVCVK